MLEDLRVEEIACDKDISYVGFSLLLVVPMLNLLLFLEQRIMYISFVVIRFFNAGSSYQFVV